MGKELHSANSNALKIAGHFSKSPCAVYFGDSGCIEEGLSRTNEALNEYRINKNMIVKLAILLCLNNGIQVGLGGSCLDQLLIESKGGDPHILLKKKGDINRRRIMVPMSSEAVFYDGPVAAEHDAIHNPGNIDLRILTDNEAILSQITSGAVKIREDIGEVEATSRSPSQRYSWDHIYRQAWDTLSPKDRRKLMLLPSIDDRSLSILRYIFEKDFIGIPFEEITAGNLSVAQIMRVRTLNADKYRTTPVESESLNIVCNTTNNSRSPERCFNIDSLVGILSMDVPLMERRSLRDFLGKAEPHITLPLLPKKISISSEAIAYFERGIEEGNTSIMDQWTEVVIRSLRKSLTHGVYEYDKYSMKETKRLMDKMAQKWTSAGNVQKHSDTIIIKNMRELEVCAEFDRERTKKMINTLGIKQIFDLCWSRYTQIESFSVDQYYMAELLGKSLNRYAFG